MESKRFSAPDVRGYDQAYQLSYNMAAEALKTTKDVDEQCRKAAAECHISGGRGALRLMFLGHEYTIELPEVDIKSVETMEPVPLRDKLLMLHYINTAKGTPITGRPVTFRELPAGPVYFPTYTKRAIIPFVEAFAAEPDRLTSAALALGGRKGDSGDASAVIDAFPRVAITYVLWAGDDELPPQGNILYDANVPDYLPTEDITVLTESITWRLVRWRQ